MDSVLNKAVISETPHWSHDDKIRVVVESEQPGAVKTEVAQRNGISIGQLYSWRRALKEGRLQASGSFMNVEVIPDKPEVAAEATPVRSGIEIMLKGGHSMRLEKDFDDQLLKRILSVMEGV